jgi:hypothetical protein
MAGEGSFRTLFSGEIQCRQAGRPRAHAVAAACLSGDQATSRLRGRWGSSRLQWSLEICAPRSEICTLLPASGQRSRRAAARERIENGLMALIAKSDAGTNRISLEFTFQHILKFVECVVNAFRPLSNDRLIRRAR